MAEIKLYKHQKAFKEKILKCFKKGQRHVLGQSPTGSGKTVIFSSIAADVSRKNKKVLIITDRTELLTQAGGTIESFNMNPFLIQAGTKFIDKTKIVYIGMSQTLRNRLQVPVWRNFIKNEIDLIIIDEAHKQEFNHFFEDDFLKDKFVIGFTATPTRAGKMTQLGLQYDTIISGKPIKWLIKKGYLLNCDVYDCGSPDMTNVAINNAKGDYQEQSMFKTYDSPKLYKGLVKNYSKICPGEKMMVFCCNVEHAIKTTHRLKKAGINAKFISSAKLPPKAPRKWTPANKAIYDEKFKSYKLYQKHFHKLSGERDDIFKWFKSSTDGVLVNIDIATTGFDDPGVKVIAIYRATMSLVLYLQIIGRGARVVKDGSIEKSHFTVLDFGGNKARFGPYDVDRGWGLWHEEAKPGGGIPPMKVCGEDSKFNKLKGAGDVEKGCERLIPASLKICPFCGFIAYKKTTTEEAELALAEIVDEKGVSLKMKAFKDMTFAELKKYREIKKHPMPWLWRMLYLNHKGIDGVSKFAKENHWGQQVTKKAIEYCLNTYES